MISRRHILTGLAASVSLPVWAQALPSNPDVIIIGAGSAGLAAARELISQGKTFIILEAAHRIGGRAYTESDTFGTPFDHGCSWISRGYENPYKKLADKWNYTTLEHSGVGESFYVGDRLATHQETNDWWRTWEHVENSAAKAGSDNQDVPASTVIDMDRPYSAVAQSWIGPMDMGVDFKDLSTMDYWRMGDTAPNFMVKEGHGAIVQQLGQGLPVQLNTRATHIDYSGAGVKVTTANGTISAKACIVTVSTGVLGAEKIKFTPPLSVDKQQAIQDVPMGLLVKIPLLFDGEKFGLGANRWLTYAIPNTVPAEVCYYLSWPFQSNLMIGFVGGDFGWELSKAGAPTAIDFALGEMRKMFGSSVDKHFVKGFMTGWANNPFTYGAYSAARPGKHHAREIIGAPVADRVFFAGEALAGEMASLCGGAYLSGQATALKVADTIA